MEPPEVEVDGISPNIIIYLLLIDVLLIKFNSTNCISIYGYMHTHAHGGGNHIKTDGK